MNLSLLVFFCLVGQGKSKSEGRPCLLWLAEGWSVHISSLSVDLWIWLKTWKKPGPGVVQLWEMGWKINGSGLFSLQGWNCPVLSVCLLVSCSLDHGRVSDDLSVLLSGHSSPDVTERGLKEVEGVGMRADVVQVWTAVEVYAEGFI